METFAALLAICARNSPVPGEFPAQKAVTRSFRAHYDVIVMIHELSWQLVREGSGKGLATNRQQAIAWKFSYMHT